ncbi:hypothetical protein WG628_09950 [Stenotrophomonas maltophilia]
MDTSSDPTDVMTAPRPSGWVRSGERWDLWWNGRCVAIIVPHASAGVRLWLETPTTVQAKVVAAANARQARRYAERWCAVRLCPQLRLRAAVARLLQPAPDAGGSPKPALTRVQRQQARRLAQAGAGEMGRIKQALALRNSTQARPRPMF